jgi:hypothetical protein
MNFCVCVCNKILFAFATETNVIRVINSRRMRWGGHESREKCVKNVGWKI